MTNEERIAKLPKWAQEHIRRLTVEVDSLRKDNLALSEQYPESKVRAIWNFNPTRPILFLPNDTSIKFQIGDREYIEARMKEEPFPHIQITGDFHPARFVVQPTFGNQVIIFSVDK